jgi:hypothetical protein
VDFREKHQLSADPEARRPLVAQNACPTDLAMTTPLMSCKLRATATTHPGSDPPVLPRVPVAVNPGSDT